MPGAEPQALVDDDVGGNRAAPGDGEHRIEAEDRGDDDVEEHPYDAPRVGVGEAREEIRPGDGAGVAVRDVDLDLRNHNEQRGDGKHHALGAEHSGKCEPVHPVGIRGGLGVGTRLQEGKPEHCAEENLEAAEDYPAGAREYAADERRQGIAPVLPFRIRHEAQVVALLSYLRDERQENRERHPEEKRRKSILAYKRLYVELPSFEQFPRPVDCEDLQGCPERLSYALEAADEAEAVQDKRYDDEGADRVSEPERDPGGNAEEPRKDGGLEGEEDESEGGIDQGGYG